MPRDEKPKKGKYTDPKTGQYRHTDGDRRHRRGASAKDAIKQKRQMQEKGLPPDGAGDADEWDESEIWDDEDESGAEGEANA